MTDANSQATNPLTQLSRMSPAIRTLIRHRATQIVAGFVGIVILLGTWAVVSPVGSDPDGSFHLTSILCGSGYEAGVCEPFTGDPPTEGRTPVLAVATATFAGQCFAFQPHQSAACEEGTLHDKSLVYNTSNNVDGLYPNLYYWTNSHAAVTSPHFVTYVIRAINIALAAVLLLGLRTLGGTQIAHAALMAITILWVPLGLFLVASINPSSWTLIGVGTFWAYLWCAFRADPGYRRWLLFAGSTLAGVLAAGSRVDGAMFIAVSAIVILFVNWPALNSRWRVAAAATTSMWVAVGFLVVSGSGQTQAITSGLSGAANVARSIPEVTYQNVLRMPGLFAGIFGVSGFGSGLGWLDTPMPPLTWVLMIVVVGVTATLFRAPHSRRTQLCYWALLTISILLPAYVLYLDRMIVGENVQSRYVLPLLTVVLGFRLATSPSGVGLDRKRILLLSVGISVAHAAALHTHMRRYISGLDVNSVDLTYQLEWWPSVLPNPNLMWLAGSLVMLPLSYAVIHGFSKSVASAADQTT